MSIRQFFDDYAEAALGPEPERVATCYAPSFIVAGPEGSATFANDERFIEWLRNLRAFNQSSGMESMEVVGVAEQELSPAHTLATVEWGARFTKTGDTLVTFEIAYLLERADDTWVILAYISRTDQEDEMRRLGLL